MKVSLLKTVEKTIGRRKNLLIISNFSFCHKVFYNHLLMMHQNASANGKELMKISFQLLRKSASVRGFFLSNYADDWAPYVMKQIKLFNEGKLKSFVDLGEKTSGGRFNSLEKIVDAVEVFNRFL